MIFKYSTFKEILNVSYQERLAKNPSYSIRAFAKKLGISHSTLLEVLSGKKTVSSERAWEIGKRLGLTEIETEYLFLLVEREKIEDSPLAKKIDLRLSSLRINDQKQDLENDAFTIIAEWKNIAVYTAIELEAQLPDLMGTSAEEIDTIVQRLIRVGLVEKSSEGKFARVNERVMVSSELPNQALRTFHRQMLKKASACLETEEVEKRFFGSETFLIDEETLAEAKSLANNFLNELSALSQKSNKKGAIYHAGLQIFEISQKGFSP